MTEPISEDLKNSLIDLAKSEAWNFLTSRNQSNIEELRRLATQPPGTVSEENRTWYSALAQGREDAYEEVKQLIQ